MKPTGHFWVTFLALGLGLIEGMMHTSHADRNQDIPQLSRAAQGIPASLSSQAGAGVWSYRLGFAQQLSRVQPVHCHYHRKFPHTITLEGHISFLSAPSRPIVPSGESCHCPGPKPLEDSQAPFWKPISPMALHIQRAVIMNFVQASSRSKGPSEMQGVE